ncbi:unnamed protein product [Urochloa humidicola]
MVIHTSALILDVLLLECQAKGTNYLLLLEMRRATRNSFCLDGRPNASQKKTADTLVADNPVGFIPDEITGLLQNTYIWSVSFTDSTTDSGNITFQVNAVVGEINDGGAVIPKTPEGSQASSFMLSGGADTTMQDTPQKSHDFALSSQRAASETSLASSTTPNKESICATEPLGTPQSVRNIGHTEEKSLPSAAAVPVDSSTKTRKSYAKKRSRPSPEKKISKKLFTGEEAGDDDDADGSGVGAPDHTSPSKGT